jgi:hypothetical protein
MRNADFGVQGCAAATIRNPKFEIHNSPLISRRFPTIRNPQFGIRNSPFAIRNPQ